VRDDVRLRDAGLEELDERRIGQQQRQAQGVGQTFHLRGEARHALESAVATVEIHLANGTLDDAVVRAMSYAKAPEELLIAEPLG
jgi:hypothetical protein